MKFQNLFTLLASNYIYFRVNAAAKNKSHNIGDPRNIII